MNISDISIPEIYKESQDFRFFVKWFELALETIKYDTENIVDLYDPLKCKSNLLWMLADTMGFKYDDRLCEAFNRFVLVYFMSMIRYKGSKDGVTLAAEANLAQFTIEDIAQSSDATTPGAEHYDSEQLYTRLENTSIPVNSVYVTAHTAEGYIDVVYFSDKKPVDACIEYVRPLGMYCFQYAGVRCDARSKISVDARLTNIEDLGLSIGPTHVGHYSRDDYARMQHMSDESNHNINTEDIRKQVYYKNSKYEKETNSLINPGYRALYSLQLCNNENIVKSLISPIFNIDYGPQDIDVHETSSTKQYWNLTYKYQNERELGKDVYTIDGERDISTKQPANPAFTGVDNDPTRSVSPLPAVNPVMSQLGDMLSSDVECQTNDD